MTTDRLPVCIAELLLELCQPATIPYNVVLDIPLEVADLGDTTLEESVQNDFLTQYR